MVWTQRGSFMTTKQFPRQPDFSIVNEEWGKIILEDGTSIETRFVLSDLVITSEDILGPQVVINHAVAIRARAPSEIINKFKDKPLMPDRPIPLTPEAGYESVKIAKVEKPTRSIYRFENYILTIELEIESVARNNMYKVPSGAPLYNIRWTLKYNISK
jgi:hypothetical protein